MFQNYYVFRKVAGAKRRYGPVLSIWLNRIVGSHLAKESKGRLHYQSWASLPSDAGERWTPKVATPGQLTIVVVTYRQPEPLRCLLSSLRCQTMQNFDVIVLHDGRDDATRSIVDEHKAISPIPCRYVESAERCNDYGHSLRAIGLSEATGEYILITNGDNYYTPRLVEFAFEAIAIGKLDIVLWNMVHSHSSVSRFDASYTAFDCYPFKHRIDIGAFIARTSLAQTAGFAARTFDADWDYFERIMNNATGSVRIGKLEKTLVVHN